MGDLKNTQEAFSKSLPLIVQGQIRWSGLATTKESRLCKIIIGERERLCVQEFVEEEDLPEVSCRWKELRNAGRKQSKTHHPNIQRFYGVMCNKNTFSIILEHGPRGTCDVILEEVMTSQVDATIIDKLKCNIAFQVTDGMEYLHRLEPSIAHLHLKLSSLIVTSDFNVKISSFERSVYLTGDEDSQNLNLPEDFEKFLPPECKDENAKPTHKWDVYSFGKILEKFCGEKKEGTNSSSREVAYAEKSDNSGEFPVIKELRNATEKCLQLKPHKRPSFAGLHEMFENHGTEFRLSLKEISELDEEVTIREIGETDTPSVEETSSDAASRDDRHGSVVRQRRPNAKPDEPGQAAGAIANRNRNNAVVPRQNRLVDVYWKMDDVARRHPVLVFLILTSVVVGGLLVSLRPIHFRPPTCGKRANPANGGSANCYLDERGVQVCEYFCPRDSSLKANCGARNCLDLEPPITAHCLADNSWSMEVPYCQREVTCQPFTAPTEMEQTSVCVNGATERRLFPGQTYDNLKNGTKCTVYCKPGYYAEPRHSVVCLDDGKWNSEQPQCKQPVCPPLKLANYVSAKCDKANVIGSVCKFSCTHERLMTGPSTATCQASQVWSETILPTCRCPDCKTGPNCEHNTSWRKISSHLGSENQINYAGRSIVCHSRHLIRNFQLKYRCTCTDSASGASATCGTYHGAGGSCEHSLAQLIRQIVASGLAPTPCNDGHTPTTEC